MGKASFKSIRVSAVYVGDEAAPFNRGRNRVSEKNVAKEK